LAIAQRKRAKRKLWRAILGGAEMRQVAHTHTLNLAYEEMRERGSKLIVKKRAKKIRNTLIIKKMKTDH